MKARRRRWSSGAAVALALAGEGPAFAQLMELRGRFQIDSAVAAPDSDVKGVDVRRAFMGVEGKSGDFSYTIDLDFSNVDHGEIEAQDIVFTWKAGGGTEILAGHFRPPVTEDDLTSDTATMFIERSSFADVFTLGRFWGGAIDHEGRNWGFRLGGYGWHGARLVESDFRLQPTVGFRAHFNPAGGTGKPGDTRPVTHFALSGQSTWISDGEGLRLRARPEVRFAEDALDTGRIDADSYGLIAAEMGIEWGAWMVQAEGGMARLARPGLADPAFHGWSAQISWRPTGDTRPYESRIARFGLPNPRHPLGEGGIGSVELGVRIGESDLNDAGIEGGNVETISAVASWIPRRHVRLMANWVNVDSRHPVLGARDGDYVSLRAQLDW